MSTSLLVWAPADSSTPFRGHGVLTQRTAQRCSSEISFINSEYGNSWASFYFPVLFTVVIMFSRSYLISLNQEFLNIISCTGLPAGGNIQLSPTSLSFFWNSMLWQDGGGQSRGNTKIASSDLSFINFSTPAATYQNRLWQKKRHKNQAVGLSV